MTVTIRIDAWLLMFVFLSSLTYGAQSDLWSQGPAWDLYLQILQYCMQVSEFACVHACEQTCVQPEYYWSRY